MGIEPANKTDRKPLIDPTFAEGASGWPKADSGKASIFEAIGVVGKAKFGDEWTGKELKALDWPVRPQLAYERSIEQAERRVSKAPEPPRTLSKISSHLVEKFQNEPVAHVRAYRLERILISVRAEESTWVENQQACARLRATVEWLAQRCRDGELVCYARPAEIGALCRMQAWEWNVDDPFDRYVRHGTFKRYFTEFGQSWSAYVFFERADLERAVSTLEHAPRLIATSDIQHLSPYLRLAVSLALAKGYNSPETDDTQPVREAEVRAAWKDAMPEVPESDRAVQAIAKVIGFPDPAAIAQGLSRTKPKNG